MLGVVKHGCFTLLPKRVSSLHIKGLLRRQFLDELSSQLAEEGSFVGLLTHACGVRGTDLYLVGVQLGLLGLADALGVEEGVVDFTEVDRLFNLFLGTLHLVIFAYNFVGGRLWSVSSFACRSSWVASHRNLLGARRSN